MPTEATGRIYDSNLPMLMELLHEFGFNRIRSACVPDTFDALRRTVDDFMSDCDVVVCTGGVSMGDKDFVKAVVKDLGCDIKFGRVNMKPG